MIIFRVFIDFFVEDEDKSTVGEHLFVLNQCLKVGLIIYMKDYQIITL